MKMKYKEYNRKQDKEATIAEALKDIGPEVLRLCLTKMAARKVNGAISLHEFVLRRPKDINGVIVVEDANMYPSAILGTFIQTLTDSDTVLLVADNSKEGLNPKFIEYLATIGCLT